MNKLFNPELPVETKNGRPARIFCTDLKGDVVGRTILAGVTDLDGSEDARRYLPDGTGPLDPQLDLVNIQREEVRTYWINVYADGISPKIFSALMDACKHVDDYIVARVPVTVRFKEGDGLW